MEHSDYTVEDIDFKIWAEHWKGLEYSNLLQSWEYGEAKRVSEGWMPIRLVIKDRDGAPIALAQVLVKTFVAVIKVARLNRGPLLITKNLAETIDRIHISLNALKALKIESKRRNWLYFSLAPEMPFSSEIQNAVIGIGFKSRAIPPAGSSFLKLSCDKDSLMSNLNGKWRNMLRKAQKSDLVISKFEGEEIPVLLVENIYKKLKDEKGFDGLSDSILHQFLTNNSFANDVKVFVCSETELTGKDCDPAGVLISVHHGDTATYLVGYTNQVGRKFNVNYLMLWHAILNAKKSGLSYYDLGGLNSSTPEGIRRFKSGLNGKEYSLTGEFRSTLFHM